MIKNWLSKLAGGGTPPEVPGGWRKALSQTLRPLSDARAKGTAGLAEDTADYVLTGEPSEVLYRLSQNKAAAASLNLSTRQFQYGQDAPALYADAGSVPPAVLLRLARALTAVADYSPGSLQLTLPPDLEWAEILLAHSTSNGLGGWGNRRSKSQTLSAEMFEAMLSLAGAEPGVLLRSGFVTAGQPSYAFGQRQLLIADLVGYADAVDRHADIIRPLLLPPSVQERVHVIAMLQSVPSTTLTKFAAELGQLAVVSSKQVRIATEPLILQIGAPMTAALREIATGGKPEQRLHALRLLATLAGKLGDAELAQAVRDIARLDSAPSIQALTKEWESSESAAPGAEDRLEYPVPSIDWTPPVGAQLVQAVEILCREANAQIEKANEQSRKHHAQMRAQGHKFTLHQTALISAGQQRDLISYMKSDRRGFGAARLAHDTAWRFAGTAAVKAATLDGMTPVMLAKLLDFIGALCDRDKHFSHSAVAAFNAMHAARGEPSLLALAEILQGMGYRGDSLIGTYCRTWGATLAHEWADDQVWPFFAHHLDALVRDLTVATADYSFDRKQLFRAIGTFPAPPTALVNALFATALGTGKTDRLAAQDALANHPGKEARILGALTDGKSETRAIAAQWLARLGHEPAIPDLEKAFAREKHDVAKSAILSALQTLGRPVENYVDRESLQAEASRALAKGVPKDLEWFPFGAMPSVQWADNQQPVSPDLLRWMLVQAVKQKSPEPGALLQTYCAMFEPRDRERFGQFVLDTWLREDTQPISAEDAMQRARAEAQQTHGYMQRYPQSFKDDPNFGSTVEELTTRYLPRFMALPMGSAIGSKGLLAIAAACAAERAAAPTARYLKDWYGSRAAQGKALIAMLAWIEHPSATQLMLSIGNRFRTKSFQEEASRQAEALAERKGWTLAELADRTIPSAGFDESGVLELSFGTRSFTAKLLDDFKVELLNPDGKKIANLPEPRQDDDPERAKDSRKAFSAAKKEIKSIVQLQTERLYEALCTERDWSNDDWSHYLNRHPIVRKLVQRLVWIEVGQDGAKRSFRPLDDGSLTDVDDAALTLAAGSRIRIAHDSLLKDDDLRRWQQHLLDYEIAPLFQQLGKGIYALPADRRNANEIEDFGGHLIEAFALRGRATKLGYTRGSTEDGGWFYLYEKRFPTLGLQAVIEFTGNGLPEENRTVALRTLSFSSTAETNAWQRGKLTLASVPKILLSECYNDMRLIAAEGPGFDRDWQKKTEY